jgi:hypothetical protein
VSGLTTVQRSIDLGGRMFALRALSESSQFADPGGRAAAMGITAADWALFGQLWPTDRLLAHAMVGYPVNGKRILHLGCGLGLASLVLQSRVADITASDHHPLARGLLVRNAALNGLPALRFHDLPWSGSAAALGRFDLIIGGDLLFQRERSADVAALLDRHGQARCEIVLTDPGAGASAAFTRLLEVKGFAVGELRGPMDANDPPPFRGQLLRYSRGAASPAGPVTGDRPPEPRASARRRRA